MSGWRMRLLLAALEVTLCIRPLPVSRLGAHCIRVISNRAEREPRQQLRRRLVERAERAAERTQLATAEREREHAGRLGV